jgi:hypothetical protein
MKRLFLLCLLLLPCHALALENLDEIEAREGRRGTNTFWHGAVSGNSYTRQPQTILYRDTTTGFEVMVMSSTADNDPSLWHGEVSPANPWSGDGSRLGYFSGQSPAAYSLVDTDSFAGGTAAYVVASDGSYLREAEDSAYRAHNNSAFRFFIWSPSKRNVYYTPGSNDNGQSYTSSNLYSNTVNNTSITVSSLGSVGASFKIWKTINPAGSHIVASNSVETTYYPLRILPSFSLLDDGWSNDRGQGSDYGGGFGGQHDLYFPDPNGSWFIYMVGGDAQWYKYDLTGSDTDGGPDYQTTSNSFDSQEAEVIWVEESSYPAWQTTCSKDNTSAYWGHPGFDRWGRLVAKGTADQEYGGQGSGTDSVWDYVNRQFEYSGDCNEYAAHNYGRNYTDWSAWSDYVAVGETGTDFTFTYKYNARDTDNDYWRSASHHGTLHGNSNYEWQYPHRVQQSPDGTKINYIIEFLVDAADNGDIAWSVAYYPHPPEIVSCAASGGTVTAAFNWRTDQATSRGYTQRGWPNESANDPPPPRETKLFRLWRSSDKTTWSPVATTSAEIFERFDFSDSTWESGYSASTVWSITDNPGDGTWYYAVTSIEWSGLESRSLSNVFSITVASGVGTGAEDTAYPTTPGDQDNPGSSDFHSSFSTSAPSIVRAYNVYANDGSAPSIQQQDLIATIPVNHCSGGSCRWVDWLGNTSETTEYVIAAVDTQGNISGSSYVTSQSSISCESGDCSAVSPEPTAEGQYLLSWDDMYVAADNQSGSTPSASGITFSGVTIGQ